jgi:hypothetical protein
MAKVIKLKTKTNPLYKLFIRCPFYVLKCASARKFHENESFPAGFGRNSFRRAGGNIQKHQFKTFNINKLKYSVRSILHNLREHYPRLQIASH